MRPEQEFLSLAAELQSHILSFLPWRDILHCASVCKALRRTYMSSSELQYIIELGGQGLLPVPNPDLNNCTAVAVRLQHLRDKAHAWFKFDTRPFNVISIPHRFQFARKIVAGGHLCMWEDDEENESANLKIFPILPKPSQQTIERDWSQRLSRSVPRAYMFNVFMDPAQNLIAVAYAITYDYIQSGNESFYINLGTLDRNGVHPQAAGPKLFPLELSGYENRDSSFVMKSLKVKGLGRYIAFWRALAVSNVGNTVDMFDQIWFLQIWDWQHSTTSNSFLSEPLNVHDSNDFCFLGNDRLLIVSNELMLYSIEDMSEAPQLLARFLLPSSPLSIYCYLPTADVTSDPTHRLLCLVTSISSSSLVFIISTNIFFDPGILERSATPITWDNWGPSSSRVFWYQYPWKVGVSGNRVLLVFPAVDQLPDGVPQIHPTMKCRLRMMDFCPLAIARRQGLGRVVKEPSTVQITASENLVTSLPYVEVVSERTYSYDDGLLLEIWVDNDRIVLLTDAIGKRRLEVIEI